MSAFRTIVAITGFLVSAGVLAAGGAEYRVSGIIKGEHTKLAVVEKSDSTQHLYREGDRIDEFTIVRIETEGVTLQRGGAYFYMELEGEPSRLNDLPALVEIKEVLTDDGHATRDISFADARAQMNVLGMAGSAPAPDARRSPSRGTATSPDGGGAAVPGVDRRGSEDGGGEGTDDVARELTYAEQLNVALGLPSYAVITSVDNQPVRTPQEAAVMMTEPMRMGWTARLGVTGVPGVDVIYVRDKALPSGQPEP